MAFFDRLARLPTDDWNHHIVYLYRLDPSIRNSGTTKYIARYLAPFDESLVFTNHGGGKFQAILKNTKTDFAVAKCIFAIEGAAKIQQGQVLVDGDGNPLPAPVAPVAVAPALPAGIDEKTIAAVLSQAITAMQAQKMPADEAMKVAMETLSAAQKASMELMFNAAKSRQDSFTGNPMMDDLFKTFLAGMAKPSAPVDPIAQMAVMFETMKKFRELTGGDLSPQPRRANLLDDTKSLVELVKADPEGKLISAIFGREEEPKSLGSSIVELLTTAVTKRPDIIDNVANIIGRWATPVGTPAPAQLGTAQPPTLLGAPQPGTAPIVAGATTEHPAVAQPAQATSADEAAINMLLQCVVKGYTQNFDGAAVAESIEILFPEIIPRLQQMTLLDDSMVVGWLRGNPIMAPIASEPDFEEFVHDFKNGIAKAGQPADLTTGDGEREFAAGAPATT